MGMGAAGSTRGLYGTSSASVERLAFAMRRVAPLEPLWTLRRVFAASSDGRKERERKRDLVRLEFELALFAVHLRLCISDARFAQDDLGCISIYLRVLFEHGRQQVGIASKQ